MIFSRPAPENGKPGVKVTNDRHPVILVAYRGGKLIGEHLRSLFAQTRLPDEILIGDDSPDNAARLAIAAVFLEKPAGSKLGIIINPQPLVLKRIVIELPKR